MQGQVACRPEGCCTSGNEQMNPIAIDGRRLLGELAELSQIGAQPGGGVTRLAYSPTDLEVRSWFVDRAQQARLDVTVDPVGNILATESRCEPPVLSGSHLDSVPHGGRFDGALGVLAALEAVRAICSQTDPQERRPLGILVLAAEESSRFGTGCLGSRTIVGDLRAEDLKQLADAEGTDYFEALRQAGLQPDRIADARRTSGWFHEFVEIHIDQADDLYRAGVPVGVITGIAAPTRLWVEVRGQRAHSGAALMSERRDALTGAAELILAVETAARARVDDAIVGTVGVVRLEPESMNMVPGFVKLGVDIRGTDAEIVNETAGEVIRQARRIGQSRHLEIDVAFLQRGQPVQIPESRIAALEQACRAAGAECIRMVSRSAHDAMYLAQHGPISMVFVRNPAGVSHSPHEAANDEDVVRATEVLATYMAWAATRAE